MFYPPPPHTHSIPTFMPHADAKVVIANWAPIIREAQVKEKAWKVNVL